MLDGVNLKSKKSSEGFLHRLIRKKHAEYLINLGHEVATTKVGVSFILKNGKQIRPDIIDYTDKKIYEVQNNGEKKDIVFDNLPDGWGGGYVYITNNNCTEDYVYKPNGDMKKINWNRLN